MNHSQTIQSALAELMQQTEADGAFVIFEHAQLEKFVQFAGGVNEPLMLDLPSQPLSEIEFYRAVAFFKEKGIRGEELDILDGPEGDTVGTQFTFQMNMESIETATAITLDVFEKVYQFPADFPMIVKKGWLDDLFDDQD